MSQLIHQAYQLIADLEKEFQSTSPLSHDDQRLNQVITDTLTSLQTMTKVTNATYICLEKFYQSASLLIGLSNIKLSEPTYQAWRAYDRFHFEQVKPKLKVYGRIY